MGFEEDAVLRDLRQDRGPCPGPEALGKEVRMAEWTAIAIPGWSSALCPL